jgi:hypothetical protein
VRARGGRYASAFGQLRQLFESDGTPYHPHVSYLAAGDLALAASRAGRRLDGRAIIKQIATALPRPSPRLRQLFARADGILADPSASSAYPEDVLSDPRGERWPFERAQLRLEYGEWLRRRRQINQAKPVLGAALDAFRALKSLPWAHRAETELRACGIAVAGYAADAAGLCALTPQQRQIVALAAEGLSNQQIAERLSSRTALSNPTCTGRSRSSAWRDGISFRPCSLGLTRQSSLRLTRQSRLDDCTWPGRRATVAPGIPGHCPRDHAGHAAGERHAPTSGGVGHRCPVRRPNPGTVTKVILAAVHATS